MNTQGAGDTSSMVDGTSCLVHISSEFLHVLVLSLRRLYKVYTYSSTFTDIIKILVYTKVRWRHPTDNNDATLRHLYINCSIKTTQGLEQWCEKEVRDSSLSANVRFHSLLGHYYNRKTVILVANYSLITNIENDFFKSWIVGRNH